MLGDDPPYLSVGTEVSAKYKGAFCEAKIRKVVRSVKCRVTYKQGLGTATVTDDQIRGTLRVGASVEAKYSDKKEFVEATITKIQDCSQYTVVFDDGDITTLRRTALCLKSGRHFAESETLDQLPLTHPEHFGNPVIGGRRGRRSRQAQDESSDDEDSPPRGNRDFASNMGGKEGIETEPEIGRVVCVELGDKKKKDNWFPGLVVAPTAQDTVRIRVRDDYLVRSFKDARYGNSDSDRELDSDSSDDEPREEKDHFVAQLYKFMDDRGTPINNCPMIGSEDIDLYRLFRAVYKLGGYNRVTNQNQWKSITRRLSFSMQNSPSTHNLVKQAYKKFLHSFEDFYRKLGCTMLPQYQRTKKEEDEKKSQDDEKKEKKETKKEQLKEEELKLKKKDDVEEVGSGQESDINVEIDPETSSSEKSPKISPQITASLPSRAKSKKKVKEEEATKTRSKSKDDTVKNKASSEARETRTPSRESERRVLTKQRRLTDEELKRRGRKRKEYEAEKSKTDEQLTESAPCYKGPVEVGDRLKVYYGPTHESKVTYEAKIIDMEKDSNEPMYLVHYTGWNTRYDEWIKPSRIAQNFTQTQGRVKRNKATTTSTTSSKEIKKEDKDKDKETTQPIRSTTPLSVTSSSSRTKSPATPANNRQTRTNKNMDLPGIEPRRRTRRTSGHTDISVPSETDDDSETYESDTTESDQAKTRSKGTEERKRRDVRNRDDRIKAEDISEGDDDKDIIEEPRRGRRLRRTLGSKVQGAKSEPDSDEEQPKGRDFDLNQIRSELKGFDKAVKLELVRVEPNSEDDIKTEGKENVSTIISSKIDKSVEVIKTENIPNPKPVDSNEDIYEFKEPEPFEFEVRNKRDTNADKDKIKKRVFEEEPKSPKKKQKPVTSPMTKDTKSDSDNDSRDDDVTHDDSEDRLIISETEVSETEQENLFTYHQEMFTTSDLTETIDLEKGTTNTQADPPIREDVTLSVIVNKSGGAVEQKQNVKSSPVSRLSPELRTLDAKLINIQPILSPVVVTPAPISARLPATSTIEEKLSAAAMAFRNKTKDTPKEDEVSESIRKSNKEATKKVDASVILHTNKEDQINSKHEIDNRNREEDTTMKQEEQRRDIMCAVIKLKEEELQQLKLKKESELKKYTEIKIVTEQRKTQDGKDGDWKNEDNIGCSIIEEEIKEKDLKRGEKDKRKKVVNQEIVDSTDSSDSEQRLVIDNEEPQDIKDPISNFDTKLRAELDKFQDSQEHYPKTQTPKPVLNLNPQQQQECISDFKSESISGIINIKTDEEGETINSLLCEEEIPGSPAPPIEIIEKDNAGPSYSPPQAETNENNIVLMEMPFASAPTSGESTTSNTVATLSMALPKPVESSIPPPSLPIQHNPSLGLRQQVHQHLPALMPAQRRESNDAAPVMDNTPPTTPDSSISNISGSPREERTGGASPISEDNMKLNRDSSEADNDSGGKGQGFIGDDILMNSERSSGERVLKAPVKRSLEESQSPKKRKRSRKHSECGSNGPKKTGRPSGRHTRNGVGSDSDDTSEGSNLCLANPTSTNHTNINSATDLNNYSSRSPRQVKYNFYVEFGPELDGNQRIAVLQQKLTELRQTYNSVKVELAAIERRKKKLRRRDREATKAAKAEMQQACS
ncbi:hypothetical protein M0802_002606 [Mischocyttarus mexicanus]|nr:hypothetical protein M0802_002606 [Mischocyttarus mexicanus]